MWELLVLQTSYERKQKGYLRKTLAGCVKRIFVFNKRLIFVRFTPTLLSIIIGIAMYFYLPGKILCYLKILRSS